MSRKRWANIGIGLLGIGLSALAHAGVLAPQTVGPAPPEDAEPLWSQGQRAFGEGRYLDSVRELSRLVARHPATPHHLEAQYLLGVAFLRIGNPNAAIAPIASYIQAMGRTHEAVSARLALAEAYLGARKFHEALTTTLEILDRRAAKTILPEIDSEALLIKARSLAALGRPFRSKRTLDSFAKKVEHLQDRGDLLAQHQRIELALQLRKCDQMTHRGSSDESQVRSRINERGRCLLQALNTFHQTVQHRDQRWISEARLDWLDSFRQFRSFCQTPPHPPGRRSAVELKRYRAELVDVLTRDCREIEKKAQDTLQHWSTQGSEALQYNYEGLQKEIGTPLKS